MAHPAETEVMEGQEVEVLDLDGAFELGRFSMEDDKSDTIWFTGMDEKAEEFHVPHLRDLLKVASLHDLNGLSLEEFLMGFILMESKKEEEGDAYADLAGRIDEILEADTELRLRIESKMKPDKIEIDKIVDKAGFNE